MKVNVFKSSNIMKLAMICIAVTVSFVTADTYYVLPSSSEARCPSNHDCVVLSEINDDFIKSSSSLNVSLWFFPGNHTLSFNLTVKDAFYFSMQSNDHHGSRDGSPTPQIYCEFYTRLHFLNITHVKIDGITIHKCLENVICIVDEFEVDNTDFIGDDVLRGRALVVEESNMLLTGSSFQLFTGLTTGGAIFLLGGSAFISNCTFIRNSASKGGGVYVKNSLNTFITNTTFTEHPYICRTKPQCSGGALYSKTSTIMITKCNFHDNKVQFGVNNTYMGTVTLYRSNGSIIGSNFTRNIASGGAAVYIVFGTINVTNSYFYHNKAIKEHWVKVPSGGTISCRHCKILINGSTFGYNSGKMYGGALFALRGHVMINSCRFYSNMAEVYGGAINTISKTFVYMSGKTIFENNKAYYGAAFHALGSDVTTSGYLSVINNTAQLGVVGIIYSRATFKDNTLFSDNNGSLLVHSGEVTITGKSTFTKNRNNQAEDSTNDFVSPEGGGVILIVSRLIVQGPITLSLNTAVNGGGLLAISSTVICNSSYTVIGNTATNTGGGIYLYQSELSISGVLKLINNIAHADGGGIHLASSFLKLVQPFSYELGTLFVQSNSAYRYGGGAYFEGGSRLIVIRYKKFNAQFINNSATYGGGIYVADDTNTATCASGYSQTLTTATQSECFFQLSRVTRYNYTAIITNAFRFHKNQANLIGADLFGGLLDRCTVNIFGKRVRYSSISGYANKISNTSTSKPVRICKCNSKDDTDCDAEHNAIKVYKGEKFSLYIAAIDHLRHMVNATVHSYLDSSLGRLGEGEQVQNIGSNCEKLSFSILSPTQTEELVMYADGPCKHLGISPLRLHVDFHPCRCPLGFELNEHIKNRCVCGCHHKLLGILKVSDCNSTTLLITRNKPFWIAQHDTETIMTVQQCPSDYCQPALPPVYFDLNASDGANVLCKFDRSGPLCGTCKEGFTLSLGSSKCIHCPTYWPALLCIIIVITILAGILVVTLILLLNLTVAKGTLNGIILYSNIFAINSGLFMLFERHNVLTIFIAWLNLDIGFDVCFIKDMNTYIKVWLQLLFPMYLIFLVILIIVISTFSRKFANIVGKRNPVATLATLILVSYAKILHNIIEIFSFATVHYIPIDGYNSSWSKIAWLRDASIAYLSAKHIPLFIVALMILMIGMPYTIALTTWQCLVQLSDRAVFKWVRYPKMSSFIDAYHAPYVARNRYWTGLLLLARVVLYLTSAVNVSGEPSFNLLAVSLTITSILLLHAYSGMRIYKNWVIDVIDFTTYCNILTFTITKFYILRTDGSHATLSIISISIQFVVFTFTMVYHVITETSVQSWMKKCNRRKSLFLPELNTHLLGNDENSVEQTVTFSEVTIGSGTRREQEETVALF